MTMIIISPRKPLQ